jgi:hypothetical protein
MRASALNRLTVANIGRIKAGSAKATHIYTAEIFAEKVREIVAPLLKEF